jgi:hypothetical protein
MRNFLRLKEEQFELDVTQTVSFMNYSNLGEFWNFFHNEHGVWVHHNYVYDPAILSPKVLPKAMRDNIHNKLHNIFPDWKINELVNMFNNDTLPTDWEKAKQYTQQLDKIRDQSIIDYLPEFIDYIGK